MSEHKVNFSWERKGLEFTYKNFSRDHEWDFGNGNVTQWQLHSNAVAISSSRNLQCTHGCM